MIAGNSRPRLGSHRVDTLARAAKSTLPPRDLFWCRRWSGVLLRLRDGWHVIFHAALLDIRIFSHTALHDCFAIGSPLILAILHNFLPVLFFSLECGDPGRGGDRTLLGRFGKCGAMHYC